MSNSIDSQFAQFLIKAAKNAKNGKFGDHKIFVSALYEEVKDYGAGSLDTFKAVLLRLHKSQYQKDGEDLGFTLSRCDLSYAFNQKLVKNSLINDLNAEIHFFTIK